MARGTATPQPLQVRAAVEGHLRARRTLWPSPRGTTCRAVDMQVFTCLICRVIERAGADALFKSLADPSRRKLLDQLHAHDGQTLNELCEHLDMTRQGVTQHLNVLEAANLVATAWRGREKLHFLNPVPLQEIYERWIAKFEKPRLKAIAELKKRLEKDHG